MPHCLAGVQMIARILLLALFCLPAIMSGTVYASTTSTSSAYADFIAKVTGAGAQTISYGSGGTPIPTIGFPTISTNGGSTAVVSRSGSLALPKGVRLPISTTAKIPSLAAAALIKKALPLVPILSTGVALYDLARELGFTLNNSSGSVVVQSDAGGSLCAAATCLQYAVNSSGYVYQASWNASPEVSAHLVFDGTPYTLVSVVGGWWTVINTLNNGYATGNFVTRDVPNPDYAAAAPKTLQDFADIVAAKSAWSSDSSLSAAIDQAQRVTGDQIPVEAPTVTGPATVSGPTSVTKTPTPYGDMAKSIKTDYDCTYVQGATVMDGGSAICTERSTVTDTPLVTNPTTGATTVGPPVVTSTSSKPVDVEADPQASTKPDPVKTDCDKIPDSMGCSKFGTPDAPTLPKSDFGFSSITPVIFATAGGCPPPLTFVVRGQVFDFSYQPLCDASTNYLRPVVLVLGVALAAFLFVGGFKV